MVFDLEFGAIAATTTLPHGMAHFDRVLTSLSAAPHGQPLGMFDRGMGVLTVLHRDGTVSTWERVVGTLGFRYVAWCLCDNLVFVGGVVFRNAPTSSA